MSTKVAQLPGPGPQANFEAEQAVLGAIMVRPECLDLVADMIRAEDFYRATNAKIFQAILAIHGRQDPVDLVSVTAELKKMNALDEVGGPVFLAALSEQVGFATNVEYYAKLVVNHARIRALEEAGRQIVAACQRPNIESVPDLIDSAERMVFAVGESRTSLKLEGIGSIALAESQVLEATHQDNRPRGLMTGFRDLDRFTAGFQATDLIVIAARPSMGKTALALDISRNVGRAGTRVAFFSLEMSKEQLARRHLSSVGLIDAEKMRAGSLTGEDWARLYGALDELQELPIYVDDKPSASTSEIRGASRRMAAREGLGLVVVDYMQLIRWSGKKVGSREREVAEISASLKALARELHIPVVVLCQLNRELERRPNKRPILSDLRESGAIEQDADVVLMLYRDEVYNENTTAKGVCEGLVRKQRNGPTGKFLLTFRAQFTRFDDHIEKLF